MQYLDAISQTLSHSAADFDNLEERVIFSAADGQLYVWKATSGKLLERVPTQQGALVGASVVHSPWEENFMSYSDDGKAVFFAKPKQFMRQVAPIVLADEEKM